MPTDTDAPSLEIAALMSAYAAGTSSPDRMIDMIVARQDSGDPAIWISRPDPTVLRDRARAVMAKGMGPDTPLYGIPFAVKDNIDVAGMETTAGCPAFAYTPEASAPAVALLEAAGAICVGKTNLDQFATGLVGVRSPHGVPRNPFDAARVPGGSSSGSAVAVAVGQASFALGTDTAGSGRVPAAFNNLIGLKPSRGAISTTGVVPACRSLDCVSVFALTARDARAVLDVAARPDDHDPYSRDLPAMTKTAGPRALDGLRVAVPQAGELEFFGDQTYRVAFDAAMATLVDAGARLTEISFAPFSEAAALLYEGPWVAERTAAVGGFIKANPDAALPVTRTIIDKGADRTAVELFQATYRLEALRKEAARLFEDVDVLMTPTAATHPTIADLERDPVGPNTRLGTYTNFMNLLDLSGLAVPTGFTSEGLPFGVTFSAPAFTDYGLLALAEELECLTRLPLGSGAPRAPLPDAVDPSGPVAGALRIAVCGAHMKGLPLNHQLTDLGGRFIDRTTTAPRYAFHALENMNPPRPGLVRVGADGAAIEVELWDLPQDAVGPFLAGIQSPLGLGRVELADGRHVTGFLCEAIAVTHDDVRDITHLKGWRAYLDAGRPNE